MIWRKCFTYTLYTNRIRIASLNYFSYHWLHIRKAISIRIPKWFILRKPRKPLLNDEFSYARFTKYFIDILTCQRCVVARIGIRKADTCKFLFVATVCLLILINSLQALAVKMRKRFQNFRLLQFRLTASFDESQLNIEERNWHWKSSL